MSARRLIALTLAASFSAGCARFGDEETPRASLLPMPEMTNTVAVARGSFPSSDVWPAQDWWTRFASPELQRLIMTALADNPDFKATAARLRQSQAMVDAQAAELYPTVDANVSFSAQRFSANSVQAKLAGENFRQMLINPLILRYHLDFWGRDAAALQGAVGRSLAVAAELADARLLLASTVARAYFELLAAGEKQGIAECIVAERQALLQFEQTRLATGLAADAPILQARIALANAEQGLAAARADVELNKNLLAALAGKGADWGAGIVIEPGQVDQALTLPVDLPLHLLAHRPDISAARLHAEAAAEEIKVAETAFYPDVNLVAFTGLHSVSLSDVLLQGSSLAYAVGPSIEFPIFEGGRLRANLNYQQSAYDAAVERYNRSLVHAVQEVADALSRWRELDERLVAQRQSLADALAADKLADSLRSHGLSDRAAPSLAKLEVYQQQFRLAALVGERHKAEINIIKALGGGYSDTKPAMP
ncbi:efflux transporter outer membrane subunit [Methylomonas sp. MO1]|uniref:efflux transporter outer membrane subunit n=1 Tax=Methylomonas sp. MO1 TaxID=3073619 RepID=UPI0028A331AC|nr:efflux transporter outer membrane subunit [Methylomonas sp. MO1]MDT4290582.1 efflux transporter outer membrane subunit [Methylomonas sp. MO1]